MKYNSIKTVLSCYLLLYKLSTTEDIQFMMRYLMIYFAKNISFIIY